MPQQPRLTMLMGFVLLLAYSALASLTSTVPEHVSAVTIEFPTSGHEHVFITDRINIELIVKVDITAPRAKVLPNIHVRDCK